MIITTDFVILNNPRTGSTFVREVVKQAHARGRRHLLPGLRGAGYRELLLPNIKVPDRRPPDQHGTYAQIPRAHRHKEVVSVVRHPVSRMLSMYSFRWWVRYPPLERSAMESLFPTFPDLDLPTYLRLEDHDVRSRLPAHAHELQVGLQTVQFIQMFFREPAAVLARLDDGYLGSDRFLEDLPPIRFLRTETLSRDLYQFLRDRGYPEEAAALALTQEPLNASSSSGVSAAWEPEIVATLLHRERLLFRILQHLGCGYADAT
jgi:hypothetical protein